MRNSRADLQPAPRNTANCSPRFRFGRRTCARRFAAPVSAQTCRTANPGLTLRDDFAAAERPYSLLAASASDIALRRLRWLSHPQLARSGTDCSAPGSSLLRGSSQFGSSQRKCRSMDSRFVWRKCPRDCSRAERRLNWLANSAADLAREHSKRVPVAWGAIVCSQIRRYCWHFAKSMDLPQSQPRTGCSPPIPWAYESVHRRERA